MTENTNNTMNAKISMEKLEEMTNEPITAHDELAETTSSDETAEPVTNCCEGCDGQNGDCMCIDNDSSDDDFVDDGVSYDRFCYRAVEILNGNTPDTITDENRAELADILTAHMIAAVADGNGDTISIINKICNEYGISIDDQMVDIGVNKYLNEKNPKYDTDTKDTVTNDKKIIGIFSNTDNEDVSVATVDANGKMEISKMDKNDPITKALTNAGRIIVKTQEEYQKIAVKCMKLKKKNKKLKKHIKKLEKKLGK